MFGKLSNNAVAPDVQGIPAVLKVDVIVLDSAAVVNMLPHSRHATLEDYAVNVFDPYVTWYLDKCERVDVVWDSSHDGLKWQE